jgi:hypothetical protein
MQTLKLNAAVAASFATIFAFAFVSLVMPAATLAPLVA